jgi:hypothetical protein
MAVQLIAFLLAPCLYCLVVEWKFRWQLLAAQPDRVEAATVAGPHGAEYQGDAIHE